MNAVDFEKEKKDYMLLMQTLRIQGNNKVSINKNVSQDTWNFGAPLGSFECSNKVK